MKNLKVSMIQMKVTDQVKENVKRALELIHQAAQSKPDLIVLPENFHFMGRKQEFFDNAESLEGPTLAKFKETAVEFGTYIVAGTMRLRFPGEEKLRNTCCVINPQGEIQDMYHKIHTFNARIGGRNYAGSQIEQSGDEIVVTSIKGVPVGLSACFDVRFPEMFRIMALKGAKVILVPAIFMLHSGKDHWEVLLRARAIENQVYMVAPATYGTFPPHHEWSYGRSMVIDPWGVVMAQAPDKESVITADLDLEWIDQIREKVPTLSQRRPEVYVWPEVHQS